MIALLTGTLARKTPDSVIIDVQGVGYRTQIPFSTYYALPAEGETVSLQIHTAVKEDAINLYGFATPQEKELFQLLIGVSGVGPKLANGILSNGEPRELCDALLRGDIARLSNIPGIGKKTAERLVLELKSKLVKAGAVAGELPAKTETATGSALREDVLSALVNLGYKESAVQKVLCGLTVSEADSVETLLKQALKQLMR